MSAQPTSTTPETDAKELDVRLSSSPLGFAYNEMASLARSLETRLNVALADNDELEQLFELQSKRTVEAQKLWRESHPERGDVWPDLGELLTWLLQDRTTLQQENTALREIVRVAEFDGSNSPEFDAIIANYHSTLTKEQK